MEQPIVVVAGAGDTETAPSADFAAGLATAVAAQAAEESAEAASTAEVAADAAGTAVQVAFDAQAEVDALAARQMAFEAQVHDTLADLTDLIDGGDPLEVEVIPDDGAPPVVAPPTPAPTTTTTTTTSAPSRGWGNDWWFGKHR